MPVLLTIAIIFILFVAAQSESFHLMGRVVANPGRDWVDILAAFSIPVTAGITVYIAWQQWLTSEKARKASLHARYEENFNKIIEAIDIFRRKGEVNDDVMQLLGIAKNDARLYFEDEIVNLLDELWSTASEFRNVWDELIGDYPERVFSLEGRIKLNSLHDQTRPEMGELKDLTGLKEKLLELAASAHKIYRKYLL